MNLALPQLQSLPATRTIDLNSVPTKLWRRRRLFGLVFTLALLPVFAIILFWPPRYIASGTVIVGNLEPASSSPGAWIEKLGDPADLESQLIIAKSARMLRLVLARPGVIGAVQQECRYRPGLRYLLRLLVDCGKLTPDSRELLDHVEARYSVSGAGRSRIISIGYRSPLPEVAFMLANALLITYLEDQRAENARIREVAAAWLLKQAQILSANPNLAADALNDSFAQSRQKFYQDLYNKATDLETERRNLVNPGRLVSLAEVPRVPNFPKPLPLLAAGLAIATILAAFAALYRDETDQTVRRTRDLEALTMEPVLASLPRARFRAGKAHPLRPASGAWESPFPREAARTLYARLLLAVERKAGCCILVASAAPGEGKTFATMSLARAAAESGRRVLVIDCDLRGQAAAAHGRLPAVKGLAGILRGEIEPQEAAVQTPLPGLDVIEAGSAASDPAMLFIDGHLPKLMSWAAQYDLVLLEAPDGFLPDVGILARHAAGVLWCVRWGHTLLPDIKAALDDLHKQRVKPLGLAVTMVDPREFRYFERNHRYSETV